MNRFTDAEFEVMQILWRSSELKPSEILSQHPRNISDSTLRTFLTDLVRKRHVSRIRRGKVYYYRALTKPESAFRLRLRQLIDIFCDGSTAVLAKQLVASENLTPEELEELRQILDEKQEERERKETS